MSGDDSGRIYVILMQLTHSMTAYAKAQDHKSQENAARLHFLRDEFFFKMGFFWFVSVLKLQISLK